MTPELALIVSDLANGRHVPVQARLQAAYAAAAVLAGRPAFVFVRVEPGRYRAGRVDTQRDVPQLEGYDNLDALHAVTAAGGTRVPLDRSVRAKREQLRGAARRIGGELGTHLEEGLDVNPAGARFEPIGALTLRLR